MWVILFEDEQVTNLDPITISRPAFTISCGSYRLIDLVADLGLKVAWLVRPYLRASLEHDLAALVSAERPQGPAIVINAGPRSLAAGSANHSPDGH